MKLHCLQQAIAICGLRAYQACTLRIKVNITVMMRTPYIYSAEWHALQL